MRFLLYFNIVLILSFSQSALSLPNSDFTPLFRIANESLEDNIVKIRGKGYLRAGAHQFRALWTRDFCYGARGLFQLGREDVVRNQLSLLLDNIRSDGLLPKMFDSQKPTWRYLNLIIRRWLPLTDQIRHSYEAAPFAKHIALDSNALVLLVAVEYYQRTRDHVWWNKYLPKLVRSYRLYDRYLDHGLIKQGAFADWQDTVSRAGKTFYMNVLYYAATERLAQFSEFQISSETVSALHQRIMETFFDAKTGVYLSIAGEPYIGLDGNLLALDLGFHKPDSPQAKQLYANLKASPLWNKLGLPGFTTYPEYPKKWTPFFMRLGGVKHYHDYFYWSWEIALSAKVASLMNDQESADKILETLQRMADRDGAIFEIFKNKPELPFLNTIGYRAEGPFSWGASLVIDALAAREAAPRL